MIGAGRAVAPVGAVKAHLARGAATILHVRARAARVSRRGERQRGEEDQITHHHRGEGPVDQTL